MMDNIDFIKEIFLALKFELIKYRIAAVAIGVVCMAAILAIGFNWEKQFVSTSTITVENESLLMDRRREQDDVDYLAEATELILSRGLLFEVAKELGHINPGEGIEVQSRVINALRSGIEIQADQDNKNTLHISYSSRDPEVSFNTTRTLTELIVEKQQIQQRQEGESTYGFVSKQVESYKKRLETADLALKEFRAEHIALNEEELQKRIRTVEIEIEDLKTSIKEANSGLEIMRAQLRDEEAQAEVQSQIYAMSRQKYLLSQELNELRRQNYSEEYFEIKNLKADIQQFDNRIKNVAAQYDLTPRIYVGPESEDLNPQLYAEKLRNDINSTKTELRNNEIRLTEKVESLKNLTQNMEVVAGNQAKLAELMRDYKVTKEHYEEMLARKERAELSVAIMNEGRGLSYVVAADASYPLSPAGLTIVHFVLAAPLLAAGLPIGLIIALILLDPRIRTVSVLKDARNDADLLCVVPHYHTAFSDRVLRKDAISIGVVLGVITIIYIYILAITLGN